MRKENYSKVQNVLETGRFKLRKNGRLVRDYGCHHFIIPEGVREISQDCFENEKVFSVQFPDSVIRICDYSFERYKGKEIRLPSRLEEIGRNAFEASEIREIVIPASVKKIGDEAFLYCEKLEKVVFEEGVTEIGDFAFEMCKKLKQVIFPSTLKKIGDGAFFHCKTLEQIEFPEGLEEIGEMAFSGCERLNNFKIPDNTRVEGQAFWDYWKANECCGYCGEKILDNAICKNPDCTLNSSNVGLEKRFDLSCIKIMSRKEIEDILKEDFPKNTAVISFYDPKSRRTPKDYAPVDFGDKCKCVFMVGVHDIDIEILSDYGLTEETYLPEAKEVAKFIIKAINSGFDIICQCEYGQSRSAACAAAILEFTINNGIKIFSDYRYYPNQLVFHKIHNALREFQGEYCESLT